MKKRNLAVVLLTIPLISVGSTFQAVIKKSANILTEEKRIEKNITPWYNVGSEYNCNTWTPKVEHVNLGEDFEQEMQCRQDQEKTKDIYIVYSDGTEKYEETITETRTINNEYTQDATGTKNYIVSERAEPWTNWDDLNGHYDCSVWNPDESTIDWGTVFTQERTCSQDQDRTRGVYDVWADGTETLNRVETEEQTIPEDESQQATGTKNFKDTERADPWSNWIDKGTHYDCDTWSPNESTIDWGTIFTQERNCYQDQERTRDVYDVWADGSETFNRTETDAQTISEKENQQATGSKNFKDSERADPWSSWIDKGSHYNCGTWTPATTTINWGTSFTQERNCSQNQERTRDVYDIWADGSETFNRTETENQIITEKENQNAVGTKDFITGTENGSWSSWTDKGNLYSCGSYSPDSSTINWGQSFSQSRTCKQDQERTRTIYNVWASGAKTVKTTESETQTINETQTQNATGTKDFITGTSYGSWSSWSNSGGLYSCGSYSPDASTVNLGQSFTQTRTCKQDQTRSRSVYDVWASGKTTYKSTQYDSQTINKSQSRSSTGTKDYITGTSYGSWSSWSNSGGLYSCGSYSPDPSTVNWGQSFTQTRTCKQDQTRSRSVYDVWASGKTTYKTTQYDSQTINKSQSKSSTGTKDYIKGTEAGGWSSWSNSGGLHSCTSWSPSTSTVAKGTKFTQTRTCKQNQTRSRTIYNVWASGKKTVKNTETGSQTVNVNQSQQAVGTKMGSWVNTDWDEFQGCAGPDNGAPSGSCNIGSKYTEYQDGRAPSGYGGCLVLYWECK